MLYVLKKRTGNFIVFYTNLIDIKSNLTTLKINFITLHFIKFKMEIGTNTNELVLIYIKKETRNYFLISNQLYIENSK